MSLADKMRNTRTRALDRWAKKEILYYIKKSAKDGNRFLGLTKFTIDRYRGGMGRDLFNTLIEEWLVQPENGFEIDFEDYEIIIRW